MTATRRQARCRSTSTTTHRRFRRTTVFTVDETATTPDAAPNLAGPATMMADAAANLTGTLGHSYGADGAGSTLLLGSGAPAGFSYTVNGSGTILTISQIQDGFGRCAAGDADRYDGRRLYGDQLHAIDHPTPGRAKRTTSSRSTTRSPITMATRRQARSRSTSTTTRRRFREYGWSSSMTMRLLAALPAAPATSIRTRPTPTRHAGHSYGADGAGTTLLTAPGCRPRGGGRLVHLGAERRRHAADDQPDPGRHCGCGADGVAVELRRPAPTR